MVLLVLNTSVVLKWFTPVDLSKKYDITVYDAVFVSLAKLVDAIYVTADEKLYDKIKELNFVKFITDMKTDERDA